MAKISSVKAREILDSRGNPTVEASGTRWIRPGERTPTHTRLSIEFSQVELCTEDGKFVASVPSGASTGAYEACELRDGGDRYLGKGVLTAVANVNDVLGPAVIGMDPADQQAVDDKMIEIDGTKNKSNMGANGETSIVFALQSDSQSACSLPSNMKTISHSRCVACLLEGRSSCQQPTAVRALC